MERTTHATYDVACRREPTAVTRTKRGLGGVLIAEGDEAEALAAARGTIVDDLHNEGTLQGMVEWESWRSLRKRTVNEVQHTKALTIPYSECMRPRMLAKIWNYNGAKRARRFEYDKTLTLASTAPYCENAALRPASSTAQARPPI